MQEKDQPSDDLLYDVLKDNDLPRLIERVNARLDVRGRRWHVVGAVVSYCVNGTPVYLQTMIRDTRYGA